MYVDVINIVCAPYFKVTRITESCLFKIKIGSIKLYKHKEESCQKKVSQQLFPSLRASLTLRTALVKARIPPATPTTTMCQLYILTHMGTCLGT